VVEEPRLLLGQHDDPTGPIAELLEHRAPSARAATTTLLGRCGCGLAATMTSARVH
jgi:hypothetical protein